MAPGTGISELRASEHDRSFQGFDQTYLISALKALGENYAGVTQIPFETQDREILSLRDCGVRALRFNVKRDGSESLTRMREMAERVHALAGWHTELYIDAREINDSLAAVITGLPRVVIDHLGLSAEGMPRLLHLAERGVTVKATGFSRVDFDVQHAIRALVKANPDGLVFGTDLPSTRAPVPFSRNDVDLLLDALEGRLAEKVVYSNAAALYKIKIQTD